MMTRRIAVYLLVLLLCFCSLGISALADDEATPSEATGLDQGEGDGKGTTGTDGNNLDGTGGTGTTGTNTNNQIVTGSTVTTDTNTNTNNQLGTSNTVTTDTNTNNQLGTSNTVTTDTNTNNQLGTSNTITTDTNTNNQLGTSDTNTLDTTGNNQLKSVVTPQVSLLTSGSTLSVLKSGPKADDKIVSIYISNTNDGTVTGTLTIEGETGVIIDLFLGDTKKESRAITKSNGNFSFTGLENGSYVLKLRFSSETSYETSTYSVTVNKTATASPIVGTAVGGVGKVTATVTSASPQEIKVEVLDGSSAIKSGTISSGVGAITLESIPKGTYTVQFSYTASTGVDRLKIGNVVVTDTSTAISFTSVLAGEEKLTVSGQATAGQPILVSLTPGTYQALVTSGSDGLFSATIACAAGTYTGVSAMYQGNEGSKVSLSGSWTVTASSTKPELSINPIYDDELIVTGTIKAGIKVRLDAYDYSQTLAGASDGTIKFTLYHTYTAGTNLSFTVFYGDLDQYSYTVTKTVASATVYRTLTIGDSGTDVYNLTTRLAALKYPVSAQNVYDNSVANAVRLFQERNGLSATGVADPTTQKQAFSSGAVPYDSQYLVTLVRGDRGPLVSALQSRLKELGYYTIRVDGIFGSGTQRAVRNFQSRNGLSVTGIADVLMQQVLYSSSAIPSGGYTPTYYTTLKRSSRYQAGVVALQNRLNALGYSAGTADGYFGSRTYRAVRNFQSRNGLSVTGIADPTTQEVLYSSSAIPSSGSSVTPSTTYRLLYWGCRGDDVRRLQQALRNLGYTQIKSVDGIYGKQTYDAVRAFQKNNGLSVDGIAGRSTQNRLYGTNY